MASLTSAQRVDTRFLPLASIIAPPEIIVSPGVYLGQPMLSSPLGEASDVFLSGEKQQVEGVTKLGKEDRTPIQNALLLVQNALAVWQTACDEVINQSKIVKASLSDVRRLDAKFQDLRLQESPSMHRALRDDVQAISDSKKPNDAGHVALFLHACSQAAQEEIALLEQSVPATLKLNEQIGFLKRHFQQEEQALQLLEKAFKQLKKLVQQSVRLDALEKLLHDAGSLAKDFAGFQRNMTESQSDLEIAKYSLKAVQWYSFPRKELGTRLLQLSRDGHQEVVGLLERHFEQTDTEKARLNSKISQATNGIEMMCRDVGLTGTLLQGSAKQIQRALTDLMQE
jgi:hypothetical protein